MKCRLISDFAQFVTRRVILFLGESWRSIRVQGLFINAVPSFVARFGEERGFWMMMMTRGYFFVMQMLVVGIFRKYQFLSYLYSISSIYGMSQRREPRETYSAILNLSNYSTAGSSSV